MFTRSYCLAGPKDSRSFTQPRRHDNIRQWWAEDPGVLGLGVSRTQ